MDGRTLNQQIKDLAFEVAVDYKPWEDDLEPNKYFEEGWKRGATYVCEHQPELVPIKMWTINVYDDHETPTSPRSYTVPAATERDARLMAFILDKGIEDARYGSGTIVERGEMELAFVHTDVVATSRPKS